MSEDRQMEVWADWEAVFRPFPSERDRIGFDTMLEAVADRLYGDHSLGEPFNEVMVCGHFDRELSIMTHEPEFRVVVQADDEAERLVWTRPSLEDFQDAVAEFLAGLGFQGNLRVERVVTSMKRPVFLPEDEEIDGDHRSRAA